MAGDDRHLGYPGPTARGSTVLNSAATARLLAEPDCATRDGTVCRGIWRLTHQGWLSRAADTVAAHGAKIVLIIVVALLTRYLLHRLIRRLTRLSGQSVPVVLQPLKERAASALAEAGLLSVRRAQRATTIGSVLRSIASFVVFVVAFVLVLGELGLELSPILASAGVAGVAVGFGAQNLVKDFLSGMFMILEDQYGVGDLVDVGHASGTVQAVGLRTTQLVDAAGTVWYVRNGEVLRVGNHSQGQAQLTVDVPVAFSADTDRAGRMLLAAAEQLRADEAWRADFVGDPELLGIDRMGAEGVVLQVAVPTRSGRSAAVGRELRARFRRTLAEADIPLPFDTTAHHIGLSADARRAGAPAAD